MFSQTSNRPAFNLKFNRARFLIAALAFFISIAAQSTAAATRTVDTASDDGALSACVAGPIDCSLRGAIAGAAAGDVIEFGAFFDFPQTITLQSAQLNINKNLTINGRGARNLTVARDVNNPTSFRIFVISSNATVTISGMTVTGGTNSGIYNTTSTLTLDRVRITGNSNSNGGGISNAGTMTILNSLVDNNTAELYGAGIANSSGTLTIANTTIADNTVTGSNGSGGAGIDNFGIGNSVLNLNNVTITGNVSNNTSTNTTGGVYNSSGNTVNIRNTIISGNSATGSASEDVRGNFTSNGRNLVQTTTGSSGFGGNDITGQPDGLGALQNNGGQTDTRLPTATSPAVNAGNDCVVDATCQTNNPPVALTFDQRGANFSRKVGAAVDIGAAESSFNPTAAGESVGGRVTEANGRGIFRVSVTMTDATGSQRVAYTNQLGYYNFEDVASGQVYIFTAQHRRYSFDQPTQVQFIGEGTDGINFTGTPSSIFRFDIWNLPTKGDN